MITYDEAKRVENIKKHGFDFEGCEVIFEKPTLTNEDRNSDHGEIRLLTLGIYNGEVVFVVHIPREDSDHIISIRKA